MGFYKDGAISPELPTPTTQSANEVAYGYVDAPIDAERADEVQDYSAEERVAENTAAPEAYRAGPLSEAEIARTGDEITATE